MELQDITIKIYNYQEDKMNIIKVSMLVYYDVINS